MSYLDNGTAPPIWAIIAHRGVFEGTPTIRRSLNAGYCRCGADILAGLDDDVCAFDAIVTPRTIALAGEALAVLTGLPTYRLAHWGGVWMLDRRDPARDLAATPAGVGADVLAAHRCGTALPEAEPIHPILRAVARPRPTEPDF